TPTPTVTPTPTPTVTPTPTPTVTPTPTPAGNLTASALSPRTVRLAWTLDSTNQWNVYRGTSPSSLGPIATTRAGVVIHYDTTVTAGATYYSQVKEAVSKGQPKAS